jgi:hypothetical protein
MPFYLTQELRHTDGTFGVSNDDKQHTTEHKPLRLNQCIDENTNPTNFNTVFGLMSGSDNA